MRKKIITSVEQFVDQVLSINSNTMLGGAEVGSVLVAYNEDGTLKVNENNEIEIVGMFPDSLLFRGQNNNYPLIPKLGRTKMNISLENVERKLISEIKRRGDRLLTKGVLDDWELLVYVQHFGLATRLLDWTTNPLIALWFACQDDNKDTNAFVYVLKYSDSSLLDTSKIKSPFSIKKTEIYKPNLNNERIVAQNGWFTVHSLHNATRRFLPLEEESVFKDKIWVMEIPGKQKSEILIKLDILGINHELVYPGIEGSCKYVNWTNEI